MIEEVVIEGLIEEGVVLIEEEVEIQEEEVVEEVME